jgi:hypothetical protein
VIDDEVGEFSTPLRFISDNWGLPYLTPRIEKTHNMEHIFNFAAAPRAPRIAPTRAETYGKPFDYVPHDYPGWPAGTEPQDYIST